MGENCYITSVYVPADYGSWRGTLYLLTSDTNMRLKAKKEDIYCAPVNEVLEK